MSTTGVRCKDCKAVGVTTPRPAPKPGPRCVTHDRERRRALRASTHEKRVQAVYGLPPGAYGALGRSQGGTCAICGPWTGRNGSGRRRLAVDHDHRSGEVRGLLCSDCNQMIGWARDNPLLFLRAANYLINPPARAVLK